MTRQTKRGVKHFQIKRKFKYSGAHGRGRKEYYEGTLPKVIHSKEEILASR